MNRFSKKLEQAYPAIGMLDRVTRNGYVIHMAEFKNKGFYEEAPNKIPYIEEAVNYLKSKDGILPKRLLLVTENMMTALKVAAYIKDHRKTFVSYEDEWELFMDDFDDEEEEEDLLRVVPLKLRKGLEHNLINEYVMLLDDIGSKDDVFFAGLFGNEEIREKIEAISVCPANAQFIWIHPNQLQMPWVQELLIDLKCEVLRISEPKSEYFEEVLSYLLEGEAISLDKTISKGMLVRKIRKRRGSLFREEDIAWHLERAMAHAKTHPTKGGVLKTEDFKNLGLGEKRPMEQLNEMVGISKVKGIVSEVAAIVQEELHNEKLGTLHKHMLFLGNPGTGKTTCSELLADILAEEGDSNAVFISATRKDLIGEYVGQTAPKVARKFEEARGGVLFVDEAGFFNHSNSGGYVEEALKEFVRYMELYPDVTVIFAMYPEEAKEFLQLDAGLTSRISRFVEFDDYTAEELGSIAEVQLLQKGYILEEKAKEAIMTYMDELRKKQKKRFGNAREVRRLIESAIIVASMKHYQSRVHGNEITEQDIHQGWERLEQKNLQSNKLFGFQAGGEKYGNQSYRL